MKRFLKNFFNFFIYLFQAIFAYAFYFILKVIPIDWASNIGGFLGEMLGPRMSSSKTAYMNLEKVFPGMPMKEKEKIVRGSWNNLGRVIAEYAHLSAFVKQVDKRIDFEGRENVENVAKAGKSAILFSGHYGNWEMAGITAVANNIPLHLVYRPPNNYLVHPIFRLRDTEEKGLLIEKGRKGARQMLAALRNRGCVALLADQKMNTGISVPFMGHDAMTLDSVAVFALKLGCQLLPSRIIRGKGAHFKVKIYPPLEFEKTGDYEKDVYNITLKINQTIESWVREKPEQWLWIHDRWSFMKRFKKQQRTEKKGK